MIASETPVRILRGLTLTRSVLTNLTTRDNWTPRFYEANKLDL